MTPLIRQFVVSLIKKIMVSCCIYLMRSKMRNTEGNEGRFRTMYAIAKAVGGDRVRSVRIV